MTVKFGGKRSDWHRVPKTIRQKIRTDDANLLERLRGSIEKAAGVTMPPVSIEPWGWLGPEGQVVYGRAVPLLKPDGSYVWGVELPVSDLIVIDEIRLLRKILVHEFNHCFAYCTLIIQQVESGRQELRLSDPSLTSAESWKEVMETDDQFHVQPSNWFGEDDAREFLWYDSPEQGVTALSIASNNFYERWAKRGLPIQTPDLKFSVAGEISIPQDVFERVKTKQERLMLPKRYR